MDQNIECLSQVTSEIQEVRIGYVQSSSLIVVYKNVMKRITVSKTKWHVKKQFKPTQYLHKYCYQQKTVTFYGNLHQYNSYVKMTIHVLELCLPNKE